MINKTNNKIIPIQSIGIIHTPHQSIENMPIQSVGAKGVEGSIELFPEYVEGLTDIEGFSHLILIYHFHKIDNHQLSVVPFMDDKAHGILPYARLNDLLPLAFQPWNY